MFRTVSKTRRPISRATQSQLESARNSGTILTEDDEFIFSELQRGDVAIDLGANIGAVTSLMARTGATVHAFEPDPTAFAVLKKKFRWKWNVKLHNLAVSSIRSRMKLFFREERPADPVLYSVGSTLKTSKVNVDYTQFTEVDVIPFGDFLEQFDHIRLLKMDIEGCEVDVLDDLLNRKLLDRVDIALVETHEKHIPETIPLLQSIRERLNDEGLCNVYLNWI